MSTDDHNDPSTRGSWIRGADGRLSPAFVATLVAVPVMVLTGFITYAALRPDPATPLDPMPVAAGSDKACAPLMGALPGKLGDYGDKSVSGTTARWRSRSGDSV
ncbi:DUF3515 family protein, partial [Gordonia sp. (in: high G+C Gram-positive bacteria)]|uniref:DUF3515 family protein n=1 Tax=Gordonia sp. (in: high G+C Gram-positive bacteria) TaxID=84139 RepID=UPI0039E36AB2